MKKQNLKTIKLNKHIISTLNTITGGRAYNAPVKPGTDISYCHAGSNMDCCA